MNRLKGTTAYLAGSVDHHEDPRKWRKEVARNLLQPLGIGVYDPLVKPGWMCSQAKTSPGRYRPLCEGQLYGACQGKAAQEHIGLDGESP